MNINTIHTSAGPVRIPEFIEDEALAHLAQRIVRIADKHAKLNEDLASAETKHAELVSLTEDQIKAADDLDRDARLLALTEDKPAPTELKAPKVRKRVEGQRATSESEVGVLRGDVELVGQLLGNLASEWHKAIREASMWKKKIAAHALNQAEAARTALIEYSKAIKDLRETRELAATAGVYVPSTNDFMDHRYANTEAVCVDLMRVVAKGLAGECGVSNLPRSKWGSSRITELPHTGDGMPNPFTQGGARLVVEHDGVEQAKPARVRHAVPSGRL